MWILSAFFIMSEEYCPTYFKAKKTMFSRITILCFHENAVYINENSILVTRVTEIM